MSLTDVASSELPEQSDASREPSSRRRRRRRRGVRVAAVAAAMVVAVGAWGLSSLRHGAVSTTPFFGLNVPKASPTAFQTLAAQIGVEPSVSSVFVKLDSVQVRQTIAALPSSVTPFVTLEPWSANSEWGDEALPQYSLRSIITSAHDAALVKLAEELVAAGRPLYLRFAHEMNGTWYPWAESVNGNAPGEYRAAWRHVHDLLAPILGRLATWVWSPNILSGVGADAPALSELYPGDAYVDLVGMTGYSHGPSVPVTYCPTMNSLAHLTGKPVVLSEIGFDGPDKPAWLRQLGPFVKANPTVVGLVYFNTSYATTGATGEYRLDAAHATASSRRSAALNFAAMKDAMTDLGTASASTAGLRCGG